MTRSAPARSLAARAAPARRRGRADGMGDEHLAGRARSARSPAASWRAATPAPRGGSGAGSRLRAVALRARAGARAPGWSCRAPCRRPGRRRGRGRRGARASGPRPPGRGGASSRSASPGSHAREALRARAGPSSVSRATAPPRPATSRRPRPRRRRSSADARRPARRRIASAKLTPARLAARSRLSQWSSTSRRRSRSSSTHCPRTSASPSAPARSARDSRGGEGLAVERHVDRKSSSASAPRPDGGFAADGDADLGRAAGGRAPPVGHPDDDAGRLEGAGRRAGRWNASRGVQAQRLEDLARVDQRPRARGTSRRRAGRARAATGAGRLLRRRPAYSRSAWPSGRCWALPARRAASCRWRGRRTAPRRPCGSRRGGSRRGRRGSRPGSAPGGSSCVPRRSARPLARGRRPSISSHSARGRGGRGTRRRPSAAPRRRAPRARRRGGGGGAARPASPRRPASCTARVTNARPSSRQ